MSRALRILDGGGLRVIRSQRGAWEVLRGRERVATVAADPKSDSVPRVIGDPDVRVKVLGEFTRLSSDDAIEPAAISDWLRGVLRTECRAVRIGPSLVFVPRARAELAERLCGAMSREGWGADWILPGLPQTSGPALHAAIVGGISSELGEIRREMGWARQEHASKGLGDIGERRARGYQERILDAAKLAVWYRTAVGTPTEAIRAAVVNLTDEIEPLTRGGLTGDQLWGMAEGVH